ncbi:MAG: transglutaminase-like domain-containing protein, partial [Streptosporangiaceae bacterium]
IPALARYIVFHSPSDEYDRMQALSQYLQNHYQYTLEDLPQGPDPLAAFLFDQPAGDCEYFASALAVMARTLGIPTRVVNGFMLGAYNPLSGEYMVRGRDAHTWVEAYFPAASDGLGRGFRRSGEWVSFDATPSAGAAGASVWPGAGLALDALSSLWQEWIVNYDWLQQARLIRRVQTSLSGGASRVWANGGAAAEAAWASLSGAATQDGGGGWRWLELLGGAGALALLGWAWCRWAAALGYRPASELEREAAVQRARRAYRRFQRYLARTGVKRAPDQTSEELLAAVAAVHPGSPLLASATAFVANYQALRFGPGAEAARTPLAAWVGELSQRMQVHLAQVRRQC